MVIRTTILLILMIVLNGCKQESDISVKICNKSGAIQHNVKIIWKNDSKLIKYILNNTCKRVKLFNIAGESGLSVKLNDKVCLVNTYFESYSYKGNIDIDILPGNIINSKVNIVIK